MILNLARPDVREYVEGFLDKLLTENDIAFPQVGLQPQLVRTGMGSGSSPTSRKKSTSSSSAISIRFLRTCARNIQKWKSNRVPAAVAAWIWASCITRMKSGHRTTPIPSIACSMQDGFTYAYTPQVMMAWVTDSPHWLNFRSTTLVYRMLSSMQGSLGIGANLNQWTAGGFRHRQEADRGLSFRAAHHRARRSLPADQPPRWKRIFVHGDCLRRQKSGRCFCLHPFHSGGARISVAATSGTGPQRAVSAHLDRG